MVRRFDSDVAQDDVLGPMFNDVAKVDWSEHLPKLTAFWCRILLELPGYSGSPLRAHQSIDARRPFTVGHFERWLELFHETVDLGWKGPNAQRAEEALDGSDHRGMPDACRDRIERSCANNGLLVDQHGEPF